ncbi:MAG: HAD-IA family hydrolase, partial [Boseongicola sp.]
EVLTPAEAACSWLRRARYAPHLLVQPDLEEDFLDIPKSDRVAVVVGDAGPYFTFDRMNAAFRMLMDGAPFLALATNRVFSDADGKLSLDAGAFVRALEYSSGTSALLLGKPSPEFFLAGANSMGCSLSEVVMIGDDAESDISGAISAGIQKSVLVKTGKYRSGDEERYPNAPSFVARDAQDGVGYVLKECRQVRQ